MTARKRFYKAATVTEDFGVALDGRVVKTPLKAPLRLPNAALAAAIAAEWDVQGEKINPATMTLTKLANTAIDGIGQHRAAVLAEMLEYAGSDLVCYRAEAPAGLVARQSAAWDPVMAWAHMELDAPIAIYPGVMHQLQPDTALGAIAKAMAALTDFQITAYHSIMTLTGSALLAMMLSRRAITPEAAWAVSHVDEDYQIEQWGQDEEAAERRARRHVEFLACCRFLDLAAPGRA